MEAEINRDNRMYMKMLTEQNKVSKIKKKRNEIIKQKIYKES